MQPQQTSIEQPECKQCKLMQSNPMQSNAISSESNTAGLDGDGVRFHHARLYGRGGQLTTESRVSNS
eukprot:3024151-Pyramimonas_sp.AAC.1